MGDLLTAIDLASGVQKAVINTTTGVAAFANSSGTNAAIAGGIVTLTTGTGADLSITGEADLLNALKLTTSVGGGDATVTRARTTASTTLGTLIQDGSTLNINGKTVTFKNAEAPLPANVPAGSGVNGNVVTDGSGNSTVYLQDATLADTLTAIDLATGVKTAANAGGTATLTTVGRPHPRSRRAARCRSRPARPPTCRSSAPATRSRRSASPATPERGPTSPRVAPRRPAASPARP